MWVMEVLKWKINIKCTSFRKELSNLSLIYAKNVWYIKHSHTHVRWFQIQNKKKKLWKKKLLDVFIFNRTSYSAWRIRPEVFDQDRHLQIWICTATLSDNRPTFMAVSRYRSCFYRAYTEDILHIYVYSKGHSLVIYVLAVQFIVVWINTFTCNLMSWWFDRMNQNGSTVLGVP